MQANPAGSYTGPLRALADRIDQQDPGAFNNLGVLYHTRGLHAEAVDAFLRALSLDPRLRAAARNLEIAARQPGACDARLAAVEARIAANPDDRAARRERAQLVRLLGRTDAAAHQLDALIAEDPDDAEALFERGLLEQRAGDLRRAQRWFERAVNAGAVGNARLHLAEVLYQRGQYAQALAGLDALVRDYPDQADAHLLRGFVLGDMGNHEAAIEAARRAAQLNPALEALQVDLVIETTAAHHDTVAAGVMTVQPDGALARHGLGLAFRQRGYFREARVEFERALAQGEDVRLVQHALAELDLLDGDSASARARYELLLGLEETSRGWNEHGVALHQAGEVSGAADSYRRALRIDPRHALAYNNLGVALADRGDTQAAREAFLRAAELDPTLVLARLNLARWYARHDDAVAALSLLRELAEFHPQEAEVWHVLGRVLAHTARLEEARAALVKAIEARPAHAEARYALARVLEQLGDGDGAVRETHRALAAASVHKVDRLTVGIDLQRECPDAVGPVDLLSLVGGTPLVGVAIGDREVDALLPERPHHAPPLPSVGERARRHCEAADDYAVRILHGEAVERYRAARDLLETALAPDADAAEASASSDERAVWRALWIRAALGEARSECLLRREAGALSLLRRLSRQVNDSADVLVLLAASLTAQDGTAYRDEARSALLRVLRRDVDSAALLHYAGNVSVRLRDEPLALGFYRRALAHDPMRPTPRVAIARLLRDRGDLLAARLELVAALAAAPGWPDAVVELARVHRDARRLPDARSVLVEHLMAIPTDLDALALLAEVLLAEERHADARVAVNRVLRHDADHPQAIWMDGVLLAAQSRLRDAVDRWSRLSLRTDAEPWSRRARAAVARFPHGDAAADTEAVDACIFDETWPGGPARPASPPAAPVITAHVA
ncbi:tetratricopeptide repeat protein [Gemmatimonas sp.]|jgi:tetratricopeptide (TPR) repeat protein|uniref:tetratricopeptide repeat protein n=1 Tax=Gemmatimonas sp. TaxID=1962908 RepID=UPI0037BE9849